MTVRDHIYNSYANLAMAHTAVTNKQEKYEPFVLSRLCQS